MHRAVMPRKVVRVTFLYGFIAQVFEFIAVVSLLSLVFVFPALCYPLLLLRHPPAPLFNALFPVPLLVCIFSSSRTSGGNRLRWCLCVHYCVCLAFLAPGQLSFERPLPSPHSPLRTQRGTSIYPQPCLLPPPSPHFTFPARSLSGVR